MAGHSKWANIKHRKGAQDSKRAKIFTKILKEVTIATKDNGPDPNFNPRLRLALQNAKGANIPKDTVERAVNKGAGVDAQNYSEVTYEGYAPNGIAVFVECTTDNINRTVQNVRAAFTKYHGSLGTNGSLSFIFERKGIFNLPKANLNEDEFIFEAIDAGAEDVEVQDDFFIITTSLENFGPMQKKLEELGLEAESAQLERIPNTTTTLDIESSKRVMKLIDYLEDDDDVQNVYHNMELTQELMEQL
ncbi:MAG: YebC/PmpR family DNA-binding transcriptional regulator [Bacteroidetes bacterium]|nr:YebC/PmpR family DNA-binding transcriptional regulator [Bacteroidota bacterium]HET6245452.1 YebC/PmpR family DNA-binding transcriptional regulator [Bacteroidia bacterium]